MGQLSASGEPPCIVTDIVRIFRKVIGINASGEADCANTTADESGERRDVGANAQSEFTNAWQKRVGNFSEVYSSGQARTYATPLAISDIEEVT